MSNKGLYQTSNLFIKNLEDNISAINDGKLQANKDYAYLLGFRSSDTVNIIGLCDDIEYCKFSLLEILGVAFLKSGKPLEESIKTILNQLNDELVNNKLKYFYSKNNLIKHMLVVYKDDTIKKYLFDTNDSTLCDVTSEVKNVDESVIYKDSVLVKLSADIIMPISKELFKNGFDLKQCRAISDDVKTRFSSESKSFELRLCNSTFTDKSCKDLKLNADSLYDLLIPPPEATQMGDYLPQMSKKQKQEMAKKWVSKVKEQKDRLFEFVVEEKDIKNNDGFKYSLEIFVNICLKNSISDMIEVLLFSIRQNLESIYHFFSNFYEKDNQTLLLNQQDFKSATFIIPTKLSHTLSLAYYIPKTNIPYDKLEKYRRSLHEHYFLTQSCPFLRYSQRIRNLKLTNIDEDKGYLCDLHALLSSQSPTKGGQSSIVVGKCTYRHYNQDRFNDSGWGCAYRSLQTVISWFINQAYICSIDVKPPVPAVVEPSRIANGLEEKRLNLLCKLTEEYRAPTHEEIQQVLVDIGDKQDSFVKSKNWIGSQEVCFVLDYLFQIESKILSVSSGGELSSQARVLCNHFKTQSTPVMIGGGQLAHTIVGCSFNEKNGDVSYLVMDPHYTGGEDSQVIMKKGWCNWKKNSFWDKSSFYNLCLPQLPTNIC